MAEEKIDIKETKELALGIMKLSMITMKHVKDGVDLEDALKVLLEAAMDPEIKAALDGIKKVEDEAKDIDASEAVELVMAIAPKALELVQAIKA